MRILSQRKETIVKRIINRKRIYRSLRTVQMVHNPSSAIYVTLMVKKST